MDRWVDGPTFDPEDGRGRKVVPPLELPEDVSAWKQSHHRPYHKPVGVVSLLSQVGVTLRYRPGEGGVVPNRKCDQKELRRPFI